MNVRMPDGTIIKNVPEGTTKAQLIEKLQRAARIQKFKSSDPAEYDPNSPEFKERYGALGNNADSWRERMFGGGFENFMAGAGKSVVDVGRGIGQILGVGPSREQIDNAKERDAALMSTGTGIAGNIAGTVATSAIPGGVVAKGAQGLNLARTAAAGRAFVNPTTIAGAAGSGAVIGGVQPVGTNDSRLANALTGALLSAGTQTVIKGLGKVAEPIVNKLSRVDQRAVQTLERYGVPLDVAQKTGSQRAAQVKRALADNPVTAGAQVEQAEKTAKGFTAAALKIAGETSEVADEVTLGNAFNRVGKVFDGVSARTQTKVDQTLLNDLASISQSASNTLEGPQARLIQNQVDEVISKGANTGSIDGAAYQNIKSNLDLLTNSGQPGIKQWAATLRTKLDDALQRSASPQDFAALKEARKQYGALLKIVEAVKPDGNISPAKLYNATNVKAFGQKKAMATGIRQTELQKLAKAGARVIPERMPNSGTAPRAALQLLLPGALGAGLGYAQEGDLSGALMYGAGGVAAPKAAQLAMNNPYIARYLARGLASAAPRTSKVLKAPGSYSLGAGSARSVPMAALLQLQQQESL